MSKFDKALIGTDLTDHPAMLALPRGVRMLYVEALAWSAAHRTDGVVPRHVLSRVTDEPDPLAATEALAKAGFLAATADGWRIVDFERDQMTAEDVERALAGGRERTRRARQHRLGDHSLCDPQRCWTLRRGGAGDASDAAGDASRNGSRDGARIDRNDRSPSGGSGVPRRGPSARGSGARVAASKPKLDPSRCFRCEHVFREHPAEPKYRRGEKGWVCSNCEEGER